VGRRADLGRDRARGVLVHLGQRETLSALDRNLTFKTTHMRILSEHDVERLIDPDAAIAATVEAFRRHAGGGMPAPGRLDMRRDRPKGSVLILAGHSDDHAFALKANMHVYPESGSGPRKAASMMMLWDAVQCVPRALIAATLFNNHRTAAGVAAATRALAPPRAKKLAVFGAGKIAPEIIRYLARVRPFETIMIAGRGPQRAHDLAQRLREEPEFSGIDVDGTTDASAAVRDADVIVTVTTADAPVFPGRDVKPGAFVILAGANRPDAREADDDLIGRARIYVDHHEHAVERAGDIHIPLRSGRLRPGQIAGEIGMVLSGDTPAAASDVTVFKSMGIIAQDLALAAMILECAQQMNVGLEFDPWTGEYGNEDRKAAAAAVGLLADGVK
jgi:ornithine cyclodeaminase/alanine dehydrogenase-like protein (mu-crystallin family)